MNLVVGIDASRNRSGGAKAHIIGLLAGSDPREFGIREVHLWAYASLLKSVPDFPWLVKHSPGVLEKSLLRQVWWQFKDLPREARAYGCNVMFNTDAGSVCPYQPGITMSQDMLSYEPGEMKRYGFSRARLRLLLLRYLQSRSLRRAHGVIFLTEYAKKAIQKVTGPLAIATVINHGIGPEFQNPRNADWGTKVGEPIRCLYVSNAAPYKHPWHVVDAIDKLRRKGANVTLLLVGGGKGPAQKRLEAAITAVDPRHEFVRQETFVEHSRIPSFLANSDIFIFASSCENMPITLMEAMASGLPIACSNRGPMPEVLEDGGMYFNPEQPESIVSAIEAILKNQDLRTKLREKAYVLSGHYSWARCSAKTWSFLRECAQTSETWLANCILSSYE